mgnify:CR=1 FL=1
MRQCSRVSLRIFLSTPSARRATYAKVWNEWFRDISIHALLMQTGVKRVISIHALREEGDEVCGADRRICEISIHALREEGDGVNPYSGLAGFLFLSTPSARRATCRSGETKRPEKFLSTPSARRATLCRHSVPPVWSISIHALREEGDGGGFFVYRMVL